MKLNYKTAFLLSAIGMAAITLYACRKIKSKNMLTRVADEGYETAGDILFPEKNVKGKLHYGPVIPNA